MEDSSSEVSVETGASTIEVLSADQNTLLGGPDAGLIRSDIDDAGSEVANSERMASQARNLADDDPLDVKSLALEFDYLIYKIQDRVKTLSDQTKDSVTAQKVNHEKDIARINGELSEIHNLVRECALIESEFVKIEQISEIAKDFTKRLTDVERRLDRRRRLEKESQNRQ